ncbi:MAG: AI-2E family transporter [Pseudomonadales bacterium]|nr:AI-2E family transporter [Pseudomonadales bacterium]NIX09860.1 AI-2E family transporter [Pseudomonadales bacterium]
MIDRPPRTAALGSTSKTLIILATLIVIAAGIKAAEALMVPFLLAAFIATIASTPVFWLERHRVPAGISIALVMLGIIVMITGVGAVVAQSAGAFTDRLPFYQARLTELVQTAVAYVEMTGLNVSEETLLSYFDPGTALVMAGNTLRGLGGALSNGFLILLTVIFILAEASSFPRKLQEVLADPDSDLPYFVRFAENVNRYIGIKTTISVITGILVGLMLAVLGVDFPALWGLLAFLLNYVPTIGSLIAAIPAMLLALIQLGPLTAAVAGIGFFVINVLMGNVVEPRYMGRGLGLSTLVVFVSLVFWGWMLGPVGMLLSVPLTMTAKIAMEANPSSEWLAVLLGPADRTPDAAPADNQT